MLNLGLPYREGVQGQVTAEARELLREVADALDAKCPGRPLQINATLGSDYQLVDWLARGSVHMAVLSDLGIHMVQREGIPLVEVVFSNGAPGNWLTPAVPELTAWRVRGHSREAEPDPEARLEDHWRDLLARAMAAENARGGMPVRGRLVFRSHLSSVSFLAAVAPTLDWLEERLAGLNEPTAELNEPTAELDEIRERFWDELFRRACFRLSPRLEEGPGCRGFRPEDHWIEIEVIARPLAGPNANATRDRLVITAVAAEEIVLTQVPEKAASSKPSPRLEPLLWRLPDDLRPLFGDSNGDLPRSPVPAFESFLAPNVYFGARTYAFTVDETLRLVELNQLTSARSQLALVLPGGGVKAAYQSRVIDKLYGQEMLVNSGNQQETNAGARQPLVVDYVVGTSGGALLGFFVARLGPRGPFDLSDLLWRPAPPDGGAPDGFLTSTHVFGVTDLPRYISLVTILVVFCAVLALFALRSRGWLAPPERPGEPAPGQPEAPPKSWRGRLTLSILVALVGTPLLVKLVSGGRSLEHVPELEGLLFAVLTVVAMFGDQCLVYGAVESAGGRISRRLDWARWAGGTLILVPALAALAVRLGERRSERDGELLAPPLEAIRLMLEASATVGGTYLALVLLIGALVFLGARRAGRIRGWEAVRWIGAVALGTAVAGWSMTVAPVAALRKLEAVPLLFIGLGLTLLLTAASRIGEAYPGMRDWLARRVPSGRTARGLVLMVTTLLACSALLDLARPRAAAAATMTFGELFAATSKLDVPQGGLAVISGAVLLLFAMVLGLHERRGFYRLAETRMFGDAVLAVLVGLSLAVYVVLILIAWWSPSRMTLFELTWSFWKGLLIVSGALTALLLLWSRWGPGDRFTARLTAILRYLSGRHPNSHLISRRFVRLLLIAAGSLAVWNFVLAPGLYGNRIARDYVTEVDRRFAEAYVEHNGGDRKASYLLSTRLLATANALEQDGTRFVLAVPEDESCPTIRQDPGSRWHTFRVVEKSRLIEKPVAERVRDQQCPELTVEHGIEKECTMTDGEFEIDCLRRYVFASGSPFPVFPAHRIQQLDGRAEALVDGGYSSNVPVEAPRTVGAGQVLIVNSSNPLAQAGGGWWDRLRPVRGPLVENASRLPGFLYQRAQQMDRLSRQNLFVVSLSPLPRPGGWPILTDFRSDVVEQMQETADGDWGERIGMVESWGPPNFQVSLQVPADPGS